MVKGRTLAQNDKILPFWQTKSLRELSTQEWESLCDGCGRCCLIKLEDEDTGEIHTTSVACRLFDADTCRCRDYANRHEKVADCVRLTPDAVPTLPWLPATCAYRLLSEGKALADWHPLNSGCASSVEEAGLSVRNRVRSETSVAEEDLPDYIVDWEERKRK